VPTKNFKDRYEKIKDYLLTSVLKENRRKLEKRIRRN